MTAPIYPFHNLVLGVTGAIGAANTGALVIALRRISHRVTVLMTESANHFVSYGSLSPIAGVEVRTNLEGWRLEYLASTADYYLIAPCSANTTCSLAMGESMNLVCEFYYNCPCPITLAPSMNEVMWKKPVVSRSIASLKAGGVSVIEPVIGTEVATLSPNLGAMPKPESVVRYVLTDRRERATAEFEKFASLKVP